MLLLKDQVFAITTFILFIAIVEDEVEWGIDKFGFVVLFLCIQMWKLIQWWKVETAG